MAQETKFEDSRMGQQLDSKEEKEVQPLYAVLECLEKSEQQ
jgi:hypothetical protein